MTGRRLNRASGRDGLGDGAGGAPGVGRVPRRERLPLPPAAAVTAPASRLSCLASKVVLRPGGSIGGWPWVFPGPCRGERPGTALRSSGSRELFGAEELATVVLRDRRGPGSRQLSRAAGHWCHPSGQRLLRSANDAGSDVYCSVNPTVRGSSRSVSEVRRLQVDFDTDGNERIRKLMTDAKSGRVPMPAVVVRSSAGRWQVLWHVDPAAWTRAGAGGSQPASRLDVRGRSRGGRRHPA